MIKFLLCTIITVDNELVCKYELAEKSTWRNGKSLHLSKTNFTQVKDQSTMSEIFIFGGESTWIWLLARLTQTETETLLMGQMYHVCNRDAVSDLQRLCWWVRCTMCVTGTQWVTSHCISSPRWRSWSLRTLNARTSSSSARFLFIIIII